MFSDPNRKGEDGCLKIGQEEDGGRTSRHEQQDLCETHNGALELLSSPEASATAQSEAPVHKEGRGCDMGRREHNGGLKINWRGGKDVFVLGFGKC
jgi:hypothetical protein